MLGDNVIIEDFCIIGIPVIGGASSKTEIGDNSIIRAGTYIYAGNKIGHNFTSGNKVNIRENNNIGNNVSIGTLSVIEHNINIGDSARIHSQVFIPEYSILESNCWIGHNVVLTNSKYPNHPSSKENLQGVRIMQDAKIGANSTILPGVVVGKSSLIGAGTLVTKNVPNGVVVAGNPFTILRKTSH